LAIKRILGIVNTRLVVWAPPYSAESLVSSRP